MIRQSQQQKLLQKFSPQQIQLMKLLQIPTVQLEERIKEELEENPALEMGNEEGETDSELEFAEPESADDEGEDVALQPVDVEDFLNKGEDDSSDYSYSSDDYREERKETPVRREDSFHEHLIAQMGLLNADETQRVIAEQVIGSIDEDGYLRRAPDAIADDLAFSRGLEVTDDEVRDVVQQIQDSFDPPGIAAADLQESLIIQLQRLPEQTEIRQLAITTISKFFSEFSKKHYERVQRGLKTDDDTFREVVQLIRRLNPKPGGNFSGSTRLQQYVMPDFFIYNNNGQLELTLNSRNAPELRLSEGYKEMLTAYDRSDKKNREQRDAVLFIKQKLDSAKWFIDAIRQRQQTLLMTMQAIMSLQTEFFQSGDDADLKPMILKDVAQITGQDISTVSRVASSKYVQTEFGIYKLKFFFSEGMQTDSGEEVSTREIKSILSDIIGEEDKRRPLNDDQLTEKLQEKGYNIARRTVAKYREQLGIGVARLRREV